MLGIECKECEGLGYLSGGCEACDNEGTTGVDENQKVYVNVYAVTREFGGHEEGGWYYDLFECIDVVPCKNKFSDDIQEGLEKEYEDEKHGNISSVLGGCDIRVYIEEKIKQSETRTIPIYE